MKKVILPTFIILAFLSCQGQPAEVIILGTVHQPVENYNADSLYNILTRIQPNVILCELDSSFFTEALNLRERDNGGNEHQATVRYAENFPVKVRPYEFEGRNQYRVEQGIRPTDGFVWSLLDSLYKQNQLTQNQRGIMDQYYQLTDSLNSFAIQGARAFNNKATDEVAQQRQQVQYQMLQKITNQRKEFLERTHTRPNSQPITYQQAYQRAGAFWDLRNQTMARNILIVIKENPGAKIVVLNGYFHRYYLRSELEGKQRERNFVLKDFYDYQL